MTEALVVIAVLLMVFGGWWLGRRAASQRVVAIEEARDAIVRQASSIENAEQRSLALFDQSLSALDQLYEREKKDQRELLDWIEATRESRASTESVLDRIEERLVGGGPVADGDLLPELERSEPVQSTAVWWSKGAAMPLSVRWVRRSLVSHDYFKVNARITAGTWQPFREVVFSKLHDLNWTRWEILALRDAKVNVGFVYGVHELFDAASPGTDPRYIWSGFIGEKSEKLGIASRKRQSA